MTPFPYSVGINTLLCDAKIYMHQHEIHHLPVIDGDNIVGLIDARVFENQNYESIGDLMYEIKVIQKEIGTTVIVVSHRKDVILEMADSVVHMQNGQTIVQGPPSAILKKKF